MLAHAVVVVAALTLVLGAASCGGGEEDPGDPAAAIRELQAAFAQRDMRAICAGMTEGARDQAGNVAHGSPSVCRTDVERAFELVEKGGGWAPAPAVGRARRGGDRATATVTDADGWRAEVPLAEDDGAWKLAGFFGTAPADFERFDESLRARPFPAVDGPSVEAVDGSGRPCGELSDERYPEISGGCGFTVAGRDVPFLILTPFGAFRFDECSLDYSVAIDRRGRTWTHEWDVDDGTSSAACSDVYGCVDDDGVRPWKGQLVADGKGGFLHHAEICVRTCIGLFAGEFVTRLVRHGRGWRIEPSDLGATGFRIDGRLRVAGRSFDIRPAGAGGGPAS